MLQEFLCILPAAWFLWNIFKCFAFLICVLYKLFVKYWFPFTMRHECSWQSFCFTILTHAVLNSAQVLLCVPASSIDLGSVLGTVCWTVAAGGMTPPLPGFVSCAAIELSIYSLNAFFSSVLIEVTKQPHCRRYNYAQSFVQKHSKVKEFVLVQAQSSQLYLKPKHMVLLFFSSKYATIISPFFYDHSCMSYSPIFNILSLALIIFLFVFNWSCCFLDLFFLIWPTFLPFNKIPVYFAINLSLKGFLNVVKEA